MLIGMFILRLVSTILCQLTNNIALLCVCVPWIAEDITQMSDKYFYVYVDIGHPKYEKVTILPGARYFNGYFSPVGFWLTKFR